MKLSFSGLSVAFFGLALVLLVISPEAMSACTPSTCPDGPVKMIFASEDCSGVPASIEPAVSVAFGSCYTTGTGSYRHDWSEEGLTYSVAQNPTCDFSRSATYTLTLTLFNVCSPGIVKKRNENTMAATQTILYLPSVNATYTTHNVTSRADYPNYFTNAVSVQCSSYDNCTWNGQVAPLWKSACDFSSATAIANISYDNTCYQFEEDTYVRFQCIDNSASLASFYTGDDCLTKYQSITERLTCNSPTDFKTICTTPPIPPPSTPVSAEAPSRPNSPNAPSSSASSAIFSSLLVTLSFVALLF